jgi:tricorn protease
MMRKTLGMIALAIGAMLLAGSSNAAPKPSLADPALSPDGNEIAFVSGGDIWTAPAQGGVARLLISNPATESRPSYSPDGTRLAFQSTRDGSPNIYVLTFATGEIARLTYADTNEVLDGWSADGRWIYFSSPANDVQRQNDIFRVAATGGTPLEVSRERYLNEFESAPSPDGKTIALIAKGISNQQWWRHGHSHIDETELWLKPVDGNAYRRLLPANAKHAWPMWSHDGGSLYFMSDEDGNENLWKMPVAGGAAAAVTSFKNGRLLWPSIGGGDAIVFERGFAIWKLDPKTGQAAEVPITLRGAPAGAGERRLNETSFRSMALSPDGKKVAVIAHGEVFAASAKDGGAGQRLTHTPGAERDLAWSPDSRRLAYVSERGVDAVLVEYDFATGQERRLTTDRGIDSSPVFSPDGKKLAYVHGTTELRVITFEGGKAGKDAAVFTGPLATGQGSLPTWSPDSRWLAFVVDDRKSFANINVVEAAGGVARPLSFLANGNTGQQIAWSPDGKYLLFSTSQRSEDAQMVRVDLLPHVPKFREDAFRELFKQSETPDRPSNRPASPATSTPTTTSSAAPQKPVEKVADGNTASVDGEKTSTKPKKKVEPVEIVFDGIRERATILPLGLSAEDPVISPDGKTLIFRATAAGQENLYSYDLDELAKEPPSAKQVTASRKRKSDVAFSPDSKEVFFLEGGAVTAAPLGDGHPRGIAINSEMTVDFAAEKQVVFDEAWSLLDHRFYDPKFHGQDWARLRTEWQPYIEGAHTPDEMRRDISLMIGELNASHSGIGGGGPNAPHVGDLGLRFERERYEAGKGLVIREVVALGPAAIEGTIKPGETLVAVDGEAVGPGVNLDRLLTDKIGKRVVVKIASAGGGTRDAILRPVSSQTAAGLLYRQWVDDRRAYVDRISGGKLGYVHIADMGDQSLAQLYLDLDAQNQAKQGVVIDIRNNNGGYVNGYALDVFTRRNYMTMTARDRFPVPARQALGQRALGAPSVLVINESSLSDAEDFAEGYRALGVGKVVGVPTAGWIIYTSNVPLIDGSSVRTPFIRIQTANGEDMEGHPRPVDVEVERPLGETLTGQDAQLEAAVKVLLSGGS